MAAETLIRQLADDSVGRTAGDTVAAVHGLVDDSVIDPDAEPLGVAEAARLLGLSPHTLRYYEQEGLVRPARNASGYREYSAADLRRLVFLTRMRVSGMTMADLRRYVALADQGPATEPERRGMMLAHRDRIRQRLRELTLALEATEYKIAAYGGAPGDRCPPRPRRHDHDRRQLMNVIPESHMDLLERPLFAHLATSREDGWPQVNPMWFAWDGTNLKLTGTTIRHKHKNITRDPKVALSINDPDEPYRYLEVRGTVTGILDDHTGAFFATLASRYGMRLDGPPGDVAHRIVYVIRPDRATFQ